MDIRNVRNDKIP